jgi:hypothetical protein
MRRHQKSARMALLRPSQVMARSGGRIIIMTPDIILDLVGALLIILSPMWIFGCRMTISSINAQGKVQFIRVPKIASSCRTSRVSAKPVGL